MGENEKALKDLEKLHENALGWAKCAWKASADLPHDQQVKVIRKHAPPSPFGDESTEEDEEDLLLRGSGGSQASLSEDVADETDGKTFSQPVGAYAEISTAALRKNSSSEVWSGDG